MEKRSTVEDGGGDRARWRCEAAVKIHLAPLWVLVLE
jgi:hypothetical protein